MIAIADILQAGEKLTAVAPFLAGIQNEEQYAQALELVDHLLLTDIAGCDACRVLSGLGVTC